MSRSLEELRLAAERSNEALAAQKAVSKEREDSEARAAAHTDLDMWTRAIKLALSRNKQSIFLSPSRGSYTREERQRDMQKLVPRLDGIKLFLRSDSYLDSYCNELETILAKPFKVRHGQATLKMEDADDEDYRYFTIDWR